MSSPSLQTGLPANTIVGDRYRLLERVGEGGHATIWRAEHIKLGRPAALKFLELPDKDPKKAEERFLREAKVAAAVSHRNVVAIIDFGATEDGRPYMVMEMLEGQSLAERMRAGPPLRLAEAVSILAQALSGLGAIHDAGIVHRDLKPENIFLAEDADGALPKIVDFGISRIVQLDRDLESVLDTKENLIVGTPQYMSPEQARGLPEIDRPSDIYSMGVIAYEALTGALPISDHHVGDLLLKVVGSAPVPLTILRPDLAGRLAEVVHRALEKDPNERFGSAREMRQALLQATAKLAADLVEKKAPPATVSSDDPTMDPVALMNAVGDAYEQGDSSALHFPDLPSMPPLRRGRSSRPTEDAEHGAVAVGPPPPVPRELATDGVRPPTSPSQRTRWLALAVVALAIFVAGAVTALFVSGALSSSSTPAPVTGER